MKKNLKLSILLLIGLMAFLPGTAFSDKDKFYLGAGMAYQADAFNASQDYDNTYGVNLALGYDVMDSFSMEVQFDKFNEFGVSNPITEDDIDVKAYSLNFKYYPAKEKTDVNGYLLLGSGWMDMDASNESSLKDRSSEESGLYAKFGVGSDFVVSDKISFYLEADYVEGFGDLNPLEFYSAKIGFKIYP